MALKLNEHRSNASLTIRELARKASVSPSTILKIEHGDFEYLHYDTMSKIAAALNIHPSEISEFDVEPPEEK